MARLWVLSDLHLETLAFPEAFRPAPPDFDVLVVAGDVYEGDSDAALRVVAQLANGKPAVFVLGNHEFWGREVARERRATGRAAERRRVALLDDTAVDLAGLRFVGGTLWADGRLAGADATPALPTNEFIRVGRRERLITGRDEAVMHKRTREVIAAAMARSGERRLVVVVTHHAPHLLCLPTAYRTGWAAGNAASDLSQLTDCGQAALWVHGHIHETIGSSKSARGLGEIGLRQLDCALQTLPLLAVARPIATAGSRH